MKPHFLALAAVVLLAAPAHADPPRVVDVSVDRAGSVWNVAVTLEHPDTGWDHYADGWEVLDEDGNRIGFRELMHPHVDEQPFTRSLRGVVIPDGTREIFIRARCSVDGWNDDAVPVAISR